MYFFRKGVLGLCAVAVIVLSGCPAVRYGDFQRISANGWDAVDNRFDRNDYAWSMKFYQADDAETGQLYVGSGNNVLGLVFSQIEGILLGDEDLRPPIFAPEIRRYRPDRGPFAWEKVLDYKEVRAPGDQIFGFRYLQEYRSPVSNTKHLYAATMGNNAILWRSESGDAGTWERYWESGENGSIRYLTEHRGILYIALATDIPFVDVPGEIWATDGVTVWPVVQDGLGNRNNRGFQFLTSWNGWLYAGTNNPLEGYEIWRFAGPDSTPESAAGDAVRIVAGGGPSDQNIWAATPVLFNEQLYVGSIIPIGFDFETGKGFKGCDIIRIAADDSWETVVGPGGISGYGSGFDRRWNVYCWQMAEHQGTLYASTFDMATVLRFGAALLPETIDSLEEVLVAALRLFARGGPQGTDFSFGKADGQKNLISLALDDFLEFGADLYWSQDGIHWRPVTTNGLGNPRNYGIRTMQSAGDAFFVGTANAFEGLEVWEARGSTPFAGR